MKHYLTSQEFPTTTLSECGSLTIDRFREMDYLAIEKNHLPVELMMENAGLQLARCITTLTEKPGMILIAAGQGNNGGGGLVAARRLAGWGYTVNLLLTSNELSSLAKLQLERAIAHGAGLYSGGNPTVVVDALLGFSQRLPLSADYTEMINKISSLSGSKISLDIPSGFDTTKGTSLFNPDIILTLAAMKTELVVFAETRELLIADIGIPSSIYKHFDTCQPAGFSTNGIVRFLS